MLAGQVPPTLYVWAPCGSAGSEDQKAIRSLGKGRFSGPHQQRESNNRRERWGGGWFKRCIPLEATESFMDEPAQELNKKFRRGAPGPGSLTIKIQEKPLFTSENKNCPSGGLGTVNLKMAGNLLPP